MPLAGQNFTRRSTQVQDADRHSTHDYFNQLILSTKNHSSFTAMLLSYFKKNIHRISTATLEFFSRLPSQQSSPNGT
jgi:hypothetical protein